jgi:hypothetical protein
MDTITFDVPGLSQSILESHIESLEKSDTKNITWNSTKRGRGYSLHVTMDVVNAKEFAEFLAIYGYELIHNSDDDAVPEGRALLIASKKINNALDKYFENNQVKFEIKKSQCPNCKRIYGYKKLTSGIENIPEELYDWIETYEYIKECNCNISFYMLDFEIN